jgi:hypothetical protein
MNRWQVAATFPGQIPPHFPFNLQSSDEKGLPCKQRPNLKSESKPTASELKPFAQA